MPSLWLRQSHRLLACSQPWALSRGCLTTQRHLAAQLRSQFVCEFKNYERPPGILWSFKRSSRFLTHCFKSLEAVFHLFSSSKVTLRCKWRWTVRHSLASAHASKRAIGGCGGATTLAPLLPENKKLHLSYAKMWTINRPTQWVAICDCARGVCATTLLLMSCTKRSLVQSLHTCTLLCCIA